jgi:hypothetical protein
MTGFRMKLRTLCVLLCFVNMSVVSLVPLHLLVLVLVFLLLPFHFRFLYLFYKLRCIFVMILIVFLLCPSV